MTVVTRFAPSPTGYLHIGGARTALFNWLFARHHGGKFLLRIEDTDRARSSQAAVEAILDGMSWLGLDWDGDWISQFARAERHAEVARDLVARGRAYHCYCTPEELEEMREKAKAEKRSRMYDGRWRDRDPGDAPSGVKPVIRLKAPLEGETVIIDAIQGEVRVPNSQLDDMVLLRADGTPTYMLAVVVDDHDMGVTHIIRGDDHLTNAFRQYQLYDAMGWEHPVFAHMALMHGPDGAKLSKRHGAVGLEQYREQGYLPEAVRNYLLRVGWSHGDDEIISTEQAIEWFGLEGVGKAAARFDVTRLQSLNAHYIQQADDARLADLVMKHLGPMLGGDMAEGAREMLIAGMKGLKPRAKTIVDLAEAGAFYARRRPLPMNDAAAKLLGPEDLERLGRMPAVFSRLDQWTETALDEAARKLAEAEGVKLGKIAQPLRAALTGSNASPGMFEVMAVLGRDECLGRIDDALRGVNPHASDKGR